MVQGSSVMGREPSPEHYGAAIKGCYWQHTFVKKPLSLPPPDFGVAVGVLQSEPWLIGKHHPIPMGMCPPHMAPAPGQACPSVGTGQLWPLYWATGMEADFVEAIFYGGHGHAGLCRCPQLPSDAPGGAGSCHCRLSCDVAILPSGLSGSTWPGPVLHSSGRLPALLQSADDWRGHT